MRLEQSFQALTKLQERARELMREGFVCLVAENQCGCWIGDSLFLTKSHPQYTPTADSFPLYTGEAPSDFDPKSIYRVN